MTWEEKYKLLEKCIIAVRDVIFLHADTPEDPDPPSFHSLYFCTVLADLIKNTEVKTVDEVMDAAQERLKETLLNIAKNKGSEPERG